MEYLQFVPCTHINVLPAAVLQYTFSFLGPKELCCVSATCKSWRGLNRDVVANRLWRSFYSSRWRVGNDVSCWQAKYGSKMLMLKSWTGKYQQDNLYGHKAGVRCVKLLPAQNLLATGSLDRTLRLWDLKSGMPISVSKPHPGTVRCVAIDPNVVISGCVDNNIRLWFAKSTETCSENMFDMSTVDSMLRGHTGPISSLCVMDSTLYSGSWDCTVRAWDRGSWECCALYTYDDWVWNVASRGSNLLVAAGREVLVQDTMSGQIVRKFQNLHDGHVSCLEGTQNGKMLFTGAGDGLILAHDLRMKDPSCVVWHHNNGVNCLAFEDPWLVSASSDGCVMLMDFEVAVRSQNRNMASPARQLLTPGGPAYSVDIADLWLSCGAESDVVRVWDFTKAAENAQKAASARAARNQRKNRPRQKNGSRSGWGTSAANSDFAAEGASSSGSGRIGRDNQRANAHMHQCHPPMQSACVRGGQRLVRDGQNRNSNHAPCASAPPDRQRQHRGGQGQGSGGNKQSESARS